MISGAEEKLIEKEVILDYPREFAGKTYAKITLKRLRGKHLKGLEIRADGSVPPEKMMPIIAHSAGVSLALIEELDAADVIKLSQEVSNFLAPGP